MLALILAMIICVALGAGVVGYVMVEARREGRGEFWTAEGEELIAGVRRTTEKVGAKVRQRGGQLGSTAAARTQKGRERRARAGEGGVDRPEAPDAEITTPGAGSAAPEAGSPSPSSSSSGSPSPDGDLRAAS